MKILRVARQVPALCCLICFVLVVDAFGGSIGNGVIRLKELFRSVVDVAARVLDSLGNSVVPSSTEYCSRHSGQDEPYGTDVAAGGEHKLC